MADTESMERELKQQLVDLHREYQERAKPIIEMLARIESLKPPRPFFVDIATLDDDTRKRLSAYSTTKEPHHD